MVAGQFWLTPQLWIKGGLGFAHLYADNYYEVWDFGTGAAIMGAIGFELMSARNFAIDLQGRLIQGSYDSFNDSVTSADPARRAVLGARSRAAHAAIRAGARAGG